MDFCKISPETLMFVTNTSDFFALLKLLALTNADCTLIRTSPKPDK